MFVVPHQYYMRQFKYWKIKLNIQKVLQTGVIFSATQVLWPGRVLGYDQIKMHIPMCSFPAMLRSELSVMPTPSWVLFHYPRLTIFYKFSSIFYLFFHRSLAANDKLHQTLFKMHTEIFMARRFIISNLFLSNFPQNWAPNRLPEQAATSNSLTK